MTDEERRRSLAAAVQRGSRPGGLARACLLVARGAYPRLDPTASLAELGRLAVRVEEALAKDPRAPDLVFADVLGRAEGFGGAAVDYDDPEMSYLNRVLARRRGLPILVSVVWIEVARTLGVPVQPMAFPGHFVVAIRDTVVDPYEGGRRLTKDEVLRLFEGLRGTGRSLRRAGSSRAVVLRVLANLANAYEKRGDGRRLDVVLSDQVALDPGDPVLLARRGQLRARFDDRAGALADLNLALPRLRPGLEFERARSAALALVRCRPSPN